MMFSSNLALLLLSKTISESKDWNWSWFLCRVDDTWPIFSSGEKVKTGRCALGINLIAATPTILPKLWPVLLPRMGIARVSLRFSAILAVHYMRGAILYPALSRHEKFQPGPQAPRRCFHSGGSNLITFFGGSGSAGSCLTAGSGHQGAVCELEAMGKR